MTFKKFFSVSGHCFKVLKGVTCSIQKKLKRKNRIESEPFKSNPLTGRDSVSTEITLLEYDNPPNFSYEISENEFNESVENHWRHCRRILYPV